jgi:hypothetical protein
MSLPPNPQFPYYPIGYTGGYSWDQVSPWITQFESGNQNILNGQGSTASGYWQITNPTWQEFAPQVGVNLSQYPTAMSAPMAVQGSVAQAIFNARGIEPWSTGPQVLAALDSGATSAASSASQALTDAANLGNPNVTIPGVQQGQSVQSTGWVAAIFDTLSSLFGRSSIMILGGGLIVLAIIAAIFLQRGNLIADATKPKG